MKAFKYFLLPIALCTMFWACDDDEDYQAGEPDVDGCYGVYFPSQTTELTLDPSAEMSDTIYVMRTVTDGAISVPLVLDDETGIFSITDLSFADGESESYIVVSFANADVGSTYECTIELSGEEYVSTYTDELTMLDFSVTIDKWESLGYATFTDTFFFEEEYQAEVLQSQGNPTYFRLVDPYREGLLEEEYVDSESEITTEEGCYISFHIMEVGETLYGTSVTMSDLVYFDAYSSGWYYSYYGAVVYLYHPSAFTAYSAESYWTYSKVVEYQEDGTPGVVQFAPYYYMSGVGGWNYTQYNNMVTIVFPGYTYADYSISFEAEETENGVVPVYLSVGADVDAVKYAVYEGTLSASAASTYASGIADGTEDSTEATSTALGLSFSESGIYTIVGVTFDAEGVAQESGYLSFKYVAAGDSMPVDIACGLYATGKYGADYSSDNTMEYYFYGSELTDVKVLLIDTDTYEFSPASALSTLYREDSVDDETLAELNAGESYVGVYTGLTPGTSYTLLVYASNGYESTVISTSASTTGVLEVELADMLGTYNVYYETYDGYYGYETWVIAESNRPSKGNIMMTTFSDLEITTGDYIYGTFDADENTLSFETLQYFYTYEYYGYVCYFAVRGTTDPSVSFKITDVGKFTNPSAYFGIHCYSTDDENLGWLMTYSYVSAEKVETAATASASRARTLSLDTAEIEGTPTLQPVKGLRGTREVKTATFSVTSLDASSKAFSRSDIDTSLKMR